MLIKKQEDFEMKPWIIVLIVIAVVLVLLIVLSIVGRKLQAKQDAAQATMMDGAQSYTIMVIDKKRMRLCDAGFPQIVLDQTPKWLRKDRNSHQSGIQGSFRQQAGSRSGSNHHSCSSTFHHILIKIEGFSLQY